MPENDAPFPNLTDDDIEILVRRIEKASDSYGMTGALQEYAGRSERRRLLWHLTRTEALETEHFPALWSDLAAGAQHTSPEDVVDFLTRIESYDAPGDGVRDAHRLDRLVAYWPVVLDRLACRAYAEAPDLFDERWDDFDDVQKGLTLVQRRFGDVEIDELPDGILRDLAEIQVREDGLPTHLHLVEEGELNRVRVEDMGDGWTYNASFYDFIGAYGSRRDWEEAVLEVALEIDEELRLSRSRDGWRRASEDELVELMSVMRANRRVLDEAYHVLMYDRDDAPEKLFDVARRLRERESSMWAWTSEVALVSGVLKLKGAGEPVPEWTDDLWTLESIEGSTSRDGYEGLDRVVKALSYLPEERIVERMLELFEEPEGTNRRRPFLVLQVWPDHGELLDEAFERIEQKAEESYTGLVSMSEIVHGLIFAGFDALRKIVREYRLAQNSLLHDTYLWTIVGLLAERVEEGRTTPAGYADHVTFVDWKSKGATGRNFEHYLLPDVTTAFEGLSTERAESLLLDQLDPAYERWPHALLGVPVHPTESLVERAFELVEREGIHEAQGSCEWFSTMLDELGEQAKPEITRALGKSDDPDVHGAVEDVFGESLYREMLAESGTERMADAGKLDTIDRLSGVWLDQNPDGSTTTIDMLERVEAAPEGNTLSRVGGTPVGVDRDSWPHRDGDPDLPMTHMFTIDLRDLSSLGERLDDEVRAFSLFVENPDHHDAWEPHSGCTETVLLTDEDVEQKQIEGELPAGSRGPGRAVETRSLEIPSVVFERYTDAWFNADPGSTKKIRELVFKSDAHAAGGSLWLQPAPSIDSPFLMQFEGAFCPMDLGDMGIMYVFEETAFYQCS
jgi:hypothetical protein